MHKLNYSLLAIVAILAACSSEKKEEKEKLEIPSYSIEQFYNNENVGGGSFSPDESKLLIHSNKSGIYNAYALPVDGSEATQLTFSDSSSIFVSSYFPEDERFLFSMDNAGDEITHIYMSNLDGSVQDLTPQSGAKANFFGWSHDLKSFYYQSNARDERFFDLYEMTIDSMKSKMLFENTEGLQVSSISDDKKYIALAKPNTTSDSDLFVKNLVSGEMTKISEHEGNASFSAEDFSRDNQYLYYSTNEGGEYTYLMRYNLETGDKEKVFEGNWDLSYAYFSYSGTYRFIALNEDAKTTISMTEVASGEPVKMPDVGTANINGLGLSRSEKYMRLSVGSSTSPNNIYFYDMENDKLTKLTNSLNPEMKEEFLVDAEVVRYPSFDGTEIPAILYKPLQASEDDKVPALVWVHGGPGGQSRVGYFSLIQYLANHGYAVIAVNNRGSSGYGKTFYRMDDQNHGDGDLKDCIAAKDYLAQLGYVDTTKIGIIGGSYGGYMTMAALTLAPEEFAVGVNIFGVTNWLRTLKSIPPFWESFRAALYEEMGDPFSEDSVRLRNISPLFHTDKITKPVMVLQGANDPRVLQVESDEIVAGAKANGVPVEYVLFEDEGHGFVKKENEIEGYGKILTFLDTYLKGEDKATTETAS